MFLILFKYDFFFFLFKLFHIHLCVERLANLFSLTIFVIYQINPDNGKRIIRVEFSFRRKITILQHVRVVFSFIFAIVYNCPNTFPYDTIYKRIETNTCTYMRIIRAKKITFRIHKSPILIKSTVPKKLFNQFLHFYISHHHECKHNLFGMIIYRPSTRVTNTYIFKKNSELQC